MPSFRHFAERDLWNIRAFPASVRLNAGELDHLGPLLGFVGDQLSKLSRRSGKNRAANIGKSSLQLGIGEADIDFCVQRSDDLRWHVFGCKDARPLACLETGDELANGRNIGERLGAHCGRHRQRTQLTSLEIFDRGRHVRECYLDLSAEQISNCRPRAAIWDVHQIDAGHHLEILANHMGWASSASRTHADLAGIRLCIGDKLGHGVRGKGWVHLHDLGHADRARDRRNVTDKVVTELLIERGIDGGGATDREEGVAVCRCSYDCLDPNIAAAAWTILNDELLAESLREPLADQSRSDVVQPTGRKGHDDAHRPRRIGLRPRYARYSRQRGMPDAWG